jgi:hypothetical protein
MVASIAASVNPVIVAFFRGEAAPVQVLLKRAFFVRGEVHMAAFLVHAVHAVHAPVTFGQAGDTRWFFGG